MKYVVPFAILSLAGCASIQPAIDRAEDANDAALQGAEFTICNAASVGAVRRAYGSRPDVWRSLCTDNEFSPAE